ncbi:MAG: redoxin domain-containing protein [Fimbriimonadales bacterium]|nr:redoxin domain-containing protein [Fimbriimonadales bacterium]
MWLKKLFTGVLIVAWLALIGVTYWRMELRFLTPAARPHGAAHIDPETQPDTPFKRLQTDAGEVCLLGRYSLLNFWSPDCACSRFMEPHVRDLVREFTPRGVQFLTVIIVNDSRISDEDALQRWRRRGIETPAVIDRDGALARQFGVWAGPAAVIINPEGRIVYLGAYNIGRYCSNEQTAYAKQALEAVVAGRKPPRAKTPFYGCQVPSASQ